MKTAESTRGTPLAEVMHVRDTASIALLSNQANLYLVGHLIDHDHSIAELASKLQVPINNLAPKIHRMVRLGLAQQTGQQGRRGRPIKLYRMSARRFVLELDDGTRDCLFDIQRSRFRPFVDALIRAQSIHLRKAAKGKLVGHLTYKAEKEITSLHWCSESPGREPQPLVSKPYEHGWGGVQLKPEDVVAFKRDMHALVSSYLERACDDGEHVLYVGSVMPTGGAGLG